MDAIINQGYSARSASLASQAAMPWAVNSSEAYNNSIVKFGQKIDQIIRSVKNGNALPEEAEAKILRIAKQHGINLGGEKFVAAMRAFSGGDASQPLPYSDAGLQNVLPGLVAFIIPALTYLKAMSNIKQGSIFHTSTVWGITELKASLVGAQDWVTPSPASASFYYKAADRYVVQAELRWGWFEKGRSALYQQSQYGPMGINAFDMYMKAVARAFAIFKNAVAYNGIAGLRIQGRLNALNPATTIPAGASGSTNINKMLSTEIYNVVVSLIRLLNQQSGANITSESGPFDIKIASNWLEAFSYVNGSISGVPTFTASEMIMKNFPGSRIIAIPEYNAASGGNNLITVEPRSISSIDGLIDPSTDDKEIMPFSDSTAMQAVYAYQTQGTIQGFVADADGVLNKRGSWAIAVGQGSAA